ncbi:hypothetical protein FZEAL_10624, partial [Fusarium zealandicum]
MDASLRRLLEGYLEGAETRPARSAQLRRMAEAPPVWRKPVDLMPMEEYERRLLAMEKMLENLRLFLGNPEYQFSAVQFSMLLVWSLPILENPPSVQVVFAYLAQSHDLLDHFLQTTRFKTAKLKNRIASAQPQRPDEALSVAGSPDTSSAHITSDYASTGEKRARDQVEDENEPPPKVQKDRKIDRNRKERKTCMLYDQNRCIVTKTGRPDACHIVPFAWNEKESGRQTTASFTIMIAACFGFDSSNVVMSIGLGSLYSGLGTSDKAWNMLAMTPTLHDWWGRGYFAFKWIGAKRIDSKTTDVELEFRWMPRSRDADAEREVIVQEELGSSKAFLAGLDHYYGPPHELQCDENCQTCHNVNLQCIAQPFTGHCIESGTIITVTRSTQDVPKFEAMIILQWALIRASAMSGAAVAAELLENRDDGDDTAGLPLTVDSLRKLSE